MRSRRRRKGKEVGNITKESIADFTARGGKISKIEYVEPDIKHPIRSVVPGPPKLYDLIEGAHLFTKKTKRKRRAKKVDIDRNLIPEVLRTLIPKDEC